MVAPANYMPGWSYIFYSPHPLTVVGQVFSGASVPSSSSIDCFLSLHLLSPPLIAFSFLSGPTHQSNIYHIYASILAYLLKHANVGAFLCRRNGPKSTMGQCAAQSLFGHPPPTHPYEFQLTHQRKVLFLSNRSLEPFCKYEWSADKSYGRQIVRTAFLLWFALDKPYGDKLYGLPWLGVDKLYGLDKPYGGQIVRTAYPGAAGAAAKLVLLVTLCCC